MDTFKKKVAIEYYPMYWKEMIGSRASSLLVHLSFIKQEMGRLKIVKALSFEKLLQKLLPSQAVDLSMRCAFASLSPTYFPSQFS